MREYNEKNDNNIMNYLNICKFILFLLIVKFIISFSLRFQIRRTNYIKSKMGNYGLYNITNFPLITIIIYNIEKFIFNENDLKNLINNFRNQSLIDLQIIFLLSKNTKNEYVNIINNYNSIEKNFVLSFCKDRVVFNDIYNSFNKIKGKYTIILEEYCLFDQEELYRFYSITYGKINNNIFNYTTKNKVSIFLIKTKTLNDIYDNNMFFKNIKEIINYIFLMPNPIVNYIPIAFCPDNYYVSLTYVSMTSILNSKNYNTYVSFYIVIPNNFNEKNFEFLKSLYNQYDYFNITFLRMDDKYKKAFVSRYITTQAYYRFSLGELIPYLNKIIYLDSDTICFKDLTNLYNLNFKGKILLGQVIIKNNYKKNGFYYINSGILLMNLKKMRNIKFEKKIINIINKHYKNQFHDQAIINLYFKKLVGIFPPQYHARPYIDYEEIVEYNKKSGNIYDNDQLYFAWKYPAIKHFVSYSKPNYHNKHNKEDWWYFARISKYFTLKSYNISKIFKYQ